MGITRKAWAATAAGVLVITLAGCGDDGGDDGEDFADLTVAEIKDAVLEDMGEVESLNLAGTLPTEGGGEVTLDVSMGSDGECAGTFGRDGVEAEILRSSDGTFMRAGEDFWAAATGDEAAASAIMQVLGDKWAKLPDASASDFDELCDLDSFLSELDEDEDDDTKDATKGEVEDVDGEEALEIIDEDEDGTVTHIWIATEGEHYILKMETEGDAATTMTISDYNEPVDAETPAEGEWIDAADLP